MDMNREINSKNRERLISLIPVILAITVLFSCDEKNFSRKREWTKERAAEVIRSYLSEKPSPLIVDALIWIYQNNLTKDTDTNIEYFVSKTLSVRLFKSIVSTNQTVRYMEDILSKLSIECYEIIKKEESSEKRYDTLKKYISITNIIESKYPIDRRYLAIYYIGKYLDTKLISLLKFNRNLFNNIIEGISDKMATLSDSDEIFNFITEIYEIFSKLDGLSAEHLSSWHTDIVSKKRLRDRPLVNVHSYTLAAVFYGLYEVQKEVAKTDSQKEELVRNKRVFEQILERVTSTNLDEKIATLEEENRKLQSQLESLTQKEDRDELELSIVKKKIEINSYNTNQTIKAKSLLAQEIVEINRRGKKL